jgi:predicted transcriptional regulator of viral defense system
MAHQSFARTVRDALIAAARADDGEVGVGDLSSLLRLKNRKEHKRMLNALSDLTGRGHIVRVRQGVYGEAAAAGEPDKREVMWRLIRMRRVVTIADLEEMAGVSHAYAKEWLELLVKRGCAVRVNPANPNHPHSWRLTVTDHAEMPVDDDKAAKLRDIRLKKKKIMARLTAIDTAVADVKQIIKNMEDE